MAEVRSQPQKGQVHTATTHRIGEATPKQRYGGGGDGSGIMSLIPEVTLSGSQLLVLLAGVPLGGTLLFLTGILLVASLAGLAIMAPLFILFSPVLVPAVVVIMLAVAGVLLAGACGLTGLVAFSWVVNYVRQKQGALPEQLDVARRRVADMAGYMGQKTKEVGQDIETRAQDAKRV